MSVFVRFLEDPAAVLELANDFLLAEPVLHNLIITLLETRVKTSEPGRYWVAIEGDRVTGVVFQSPLDFFANLSRMEKKTIAALVAAIRKDGVILPGVSGEAATAASFAGEWAERTKTGATPQQGMRLYELTGLREISKVEGCLRGATAADRDLLVAWQHGFLADSHDTVADVALHVDTRLEAGQLWIWEADGPASMAASVGPAGGVFRIAAVYTPPEKRRKGYAAACVHALSRSLVEKGYGCLLYTDLGNPTSNAIYQRIGYEAVAEVLKYRLTTER
jgi:uncharacterized protein